MYAIAPLDRWSDVQAREWAKELIRLRGSDCILTPIYIEFVAGAANHREVRLSRGCLSIFQMVDEERILELDWVEPRRLAEWVSRSGKPRQFGDGSIKAIATYVNYDVDSFDEGMP